LHILVSCDPSGREFWRLGLLVFRWFQLRLGFLPSSFPLGGVGLLVFSRRCFPLGAPFPQCRFSSEFSRHVFETGARRGPSVVFSSGGPPALLLVVPPFSTFLFFNRPPPTSLSLRTSPPVGNLLCFGVPEITTSNLGPPTYPWVPSPLKVSYGTIYVPFLFFFLLDFVLVGCLGASVRVSPNFFFPCFSRLSRFPVRNSRCFLVLLLFAPLLYLFSQGSFFCSLFRRLILSGQINNHRALPPPILFFVTLVFSPLVICLSSLNVVLFPPQNLRKATSITWIFPPLFLSCGSFG